MSNLEHYCETCNTFVTVSVTTRKSPENDCLEVSPSCVHCGNLIRKVAFPNNYKEPSKISYSGGGERESESDRPRFDLLFPERVPYHEQFLTRIAVHMARGAQKYADRNWELMGDEEALNRFRSSAARHFVQWITGETDEDHAAAVYFNLMGAEYVKGRLDGRYGKEEG